MSKGPVKVRKKSRKKSDFLVLMLLVFGDAVFISGSFLLGYWLYFFTIFPAPKGVPPFDQYLRIYPLAAVVVLASFRYFGLYKRQWSLLISSEVGRIARATAVGMISLIMLTFIFKQETVKVVNNEIIRVVITYSTGVWALALISMIVLVTCWRKAFGRFEVWYFQRKGLNKRLLLIGTNDRAEQVCRGISKNPQLCYEIVGVVATENRPTKKMVNGVNVVGTLDDFQDILANGDIDEVILCVTDIPHEQKSDIILRCEREMVDFRKRVGNKTTHKVVDPVKLYDSLESYCQELCTEH